ncbi:MAG: hypothetical protein JXR68_12925 [Bacteroidales bacterium]|nr:hypothetical protein [Bacteroidales bacterium]
MNFLKKILSKRNSELTFEQEAQNEIFLCDQRIFEYEQDIHKIRSWAVDLLHKTFKVPSDYWYEEIYHLDEIINLPENKDIDPEIVDDVRQISLSYKQQIEMRKLKIDVCVKNKNQLRKMIQDEKDISKKLKYENNHEFLVEKHKSKAFSIDDTDISNEIYSTKKLSILKDKITEIKNQLLLKQEFNKQLQILYKKYGESTDYNTTEIYYNELKKLIE